MTLSPRTAFHLETGWTPASKNEPLAYALKLTNNSDKPVEGFKLSVSGPARLDPAATIENGRLLTRLSNHTELAPPDGFVLKPGATWVVTARGLSYPLRHWSDGANTAYLVLADGAIAPVSVAGTVAKGDNRPLKRGAERFPVPLHTPVPICIVPWPNKVSVDGRRATPAGLALDPQYGPARAAVSAFAELTARLFPAEGIVRPASEGGVRVRLEPPMNGLQHGPEGYRIAFGEDDIMIEAEAQAGFLYGLITLGQILRGAARHKNVFVFPSAGEIVDRPRMGFRGCHLDVARQFYSGAEIGQLLAVMAWNKLNRFHWHLTEDEAWRIEIDAYPQLTEIGAWRGHGLPIPPLLGTGPHKSGGYYSKAVVREVVSQASSYGIDVIPEIDIPGHCFALLQALPELRDPDESGEYASVQGFPNNCVNPANPKVYEFLETMFGELAELFPSKILHLGADEVPMAAWSGSPMALALLRKLAGDKTADAHAKLKNTIGNLHGADEIGDSATAVLQAEFIRKAHDIIKKLGCVTGGWEEAAHGDAVDRNSSYLVGWRDIAVSGKLAAAGYDIVVSPGQAYYLDMSQSIEWDEPGAGWAGWSGPRETYDFDPVKDWTTDQLKHFKGIQACIWSESMTDRAIFDRLVFPRLSAIAETAWTDWDRKNWHRFSASCGLMPILYSYWAD